MIDNFFKVLISVKAKLFFGFFSLVVIIALLGAQAYRSIGGAGQVVKDTYDRPLMAINFARSASQVFGQLEIEVLRQTAKDDAEIKMGAVQEALILFEDDLEIAKERSISDRAGPFFEDIDKNLALWEALVFSDTFHSSRQVHKQAEELVEAIEENLDIIVELQTNASFIAREESIEKMEQIKSYNLWGLLAALLVALGMTLWVAVTIIHPLKTAAQAARKISGGNLNVDIPPGGDDETGVLLKTLSAMQNNIRDRLGREENMRSLAQSRLSDSLNNSKDAILLTDQTGLIIVANPQMGTMFPEYETGNLIGEPFKEHFNMCGCSLRGGCDVASGKDQIKFEDGRWARVAISETEEGGHLFIWTDITSQKERSIKLKEAKEAAEAADKAKTMFLAAMSHELRTPLNAVIGFSDILEEHHSGERGDEDLAEMAGLISQSGSQLLTIVKDVLSVSQGKQTTPKPHEMTPVNLYDAIAYTAKTLENEAKQKNIRIFSLPPRDDVFVNGDNVQLKRLLLNLVSNAVKFNKENGVVRLQLSEPRNGWVRFDVVDTGIGISEAHLDKITEPFFQADNGHARKYEGVGLGLTIVRQIIETHHGHINIISTPGKGTIISVYFPTSTKLIPIKALAS